MPPRPSVITGDACIAALAHPVLQGLAAYWQSKMVNGRLPRLKELDPPLEIPRLTAHMSLLAVEGDPPRFRYRRMGSAIVQDRRHRRIKDATGQYADEIDYHQAPEDVISSLVEVARNAQPLREYGQYDSGDYALLRFEWIVLPLAGDDEPVSFLMTGYVTFASG